MKKTILIEEVSLKKISNKTKQYLCVVSSPDGYLDSYAFSEDVIIKYYIFKDKEFTVEEFDEILKSQEECNLLQLALNFISYQSRSEKEVIKHLQKKCDETQNIASVILKLKDLGYLDDVKFAHDMMNLYIRRLKGPNYIANILKEKEIDEELIKNTLDDYSFEMEKEGISKIIEKEKEKLTKYPINAQKVKLTQKLINAGYHLSAINDEVKNTEFVEEIDETLKKDIDKQLKKYNYEIDKIAYQKIISSLVSKGYNYSQIKKVLKSNN